MYVSMAKLIYTIYKTGFTGGSEDKASSCNTGDLGLIPGLGRSLEKEMATHSSILAWGIPWTVESGGVPKSGTQIKFKYNNSQHYINHMHAKNFSNYQSNKFSKQ